MRSFAGLTSIITWFSLLCVACAPPDRYNPCDPTTTDFLIQGVLLDGAPCLVPSSAAGQNNQGGFTFGSVTGNTNEAGLAAQFTIRLDRQPLDTVAISYQSSDTTEGITGNTSVQFTPTDWDTPKTISVTGQDDGLADGSQAYSVVFGAATSSDPSFSGVTPAPVSLVNDDNEAAIFRIFVSNSTTDGNMGGISGADAICNADTNKPTADNYKAFIVDNTNRRASVSANAGDLQIDWVFQASTTYFRTDNTTAILTTNVNSIFTFGTLTNAFGAGSNVFWTGLSNDWTDAGNDCTNWSTIVALSGQVGQENATGATSIDNGTQLCNFSSARLLCVQQ